MELKYTKSNYSSVVFAGLIDAAIIIACSVFIVTSMPLDSIIRDYPNLSILIFLILYRVISILLFNSTLGMRILGLTFLTDEKEDLNLKEKLLAGIFILFEGVDYYRVVRSEVE